MTGLQLAMGEGTLAGFVLAVARTAGFVLTAPPFSTRGIPARARASVVLALAIPLTAWTTPAAAPLTSPDLPMQALMQVALGVTMGYLVLVAVAVLQAVGDLIDLVGGFNLSMGMDPLLLVQTSVMGRLHALIAVTLLMATDGHLMVLQGLSRSMELMPVPSLDPAALARTVASDVAGMFAGAVQVAAPVIAVMFIADVTLGLLTRAAPALNAFALGFPVKILLTLLVVGLLVVQLPAMLAHGVEAAVSTILRLAGG